ncbi:MAG: hypothetical protein H6817_09915, partial [Phycisphaerales bacterium]|nr:hypothetical protein [Phycisphaerales bacterium]
MRRTGWICSLMLACGLLVGNVPAARGADADILKAVPEGAWAVLIVRNLGELDQKLMGLSQQLNVPPMSVLTMAKATTGLMNGVNDNDAAAFVLMGGPAVMQGQFDQAMALIVPTANYADLTANMAPEDAGEGVSKVMIAGQPSYIASFGKYAVAGASPMAVKAVVAAGEGAGVGNGWTNYQRTRFAEDDVTLFLNLKAVFSDPMLSQMLQGMAAMSGGAFNPAELQENEAVSIGLRVGKDGLRLGVFARVTEGSNSAKLLASVSPTADSLLTGLPAEKYLVAVGLKGSEQAWGKYSDAIGTLLKNPMYAAQTGIPPEKLAELSDKLGALVQKTRDLSFSISALPEGSDGIIGMTKVVSVSGGAAEVCSQVADLLSTMTAMAPDEESKKALGLLNYTADAETIAGVKVAHLTFPLDKAEDVAEEDYRNVQKVLGSEGILVRIAAIDDTHIAAALGGGSERFAKIIELAKSGAAPLDQDAGIKKAGAMLREQRTAEGYLAADTLLKTIRKIDEAVGESNSVPFEVPNVEMPIAGVMGPVEGAGFQADLAIPMAVISAAKDTAAAFNGGG